MSQTGAIVQSLRPSLPSISQSGGDDLAKVLGPVLRMPGALRQGSVYVVGIARFRKKLGANWQRYQDRIHEAIDHTIEDHLGVRDVYLQAGDETYVLSFDDPDPAHSAVKAALISRKIKEKLFGQSDIEAELHLLGEEALAAARARAEAASAEARKGGPGAARQQDVEFAFLPMWDALNKVLSTYVCLPTSRQRSGRIVFGGAQLAHDVSEVEWAEFNARTLDYASDVADELVRNQFAVFTAIQCNYKSLESARGREIFLAACRRIPDHVRKFMFVHIMGADGTVPTSTLTDRVNTVKPYFRSVSLQIPSLDIGIGRFATMGLGHLSHTLDPVAPVDLKKIAALVREARSARLLISIMRIRDLPTADKLAGLGVALLGGQFLGDALEMPSNMLRCTLQDLGRRPMR